MLRWIRKAAYLSLVWALAGCGAQSGSASKNAALPAQSSMSELEVASRRDRAKMDDLQKQITLLQDKLHAAEQQKMEALPVEVRAPTDVLGEGEELAQDYEVVGVDEEGVEIIYVGEAAQESSVAITPRYVAPPPETPAQPATRTAPRASTVPAKRASAASAAGGGLPEVPEVHDRLDVTEAVGPTVAEQMRNAPEPASGRASMPLPQRESVPQRESAASAPVHAAVPVAATPVKSQPAPRRSPAPGKKAARPREATDGQAKLLYERAYQALRAGQHDDAVAKFGDFLTQFPSDDLADNARYWLAEAFYDQRDYQRAASEFQRVIEDYPQGNKLPDAMLKVGYCYAALGEHDKARAALASVVERFPDTRLAELATSRLDALH